MIGWDEFVIFGAIAIALWTLGAGVALRHARTGSALFLAGTVLFATFIALFWLSAGHAPMRTLGETRLWYSLFIAATGWVLFIRWRYRFLLPFAAVLASVFTVINILRPEIHSQTLMPALQSAWFVPHVAIYMLSYAVMAVALALAVAARFHREQLLLHADRLVRIGSALLIIGMLMGAVWARQAWGNYWAWDAKESWAAVTWLLSLSYIHFRLHYPTWQRTAVTLLAVTFLALQITWYGINYMPSAKKSMHTYTMNR
ncbi:MAG: cytochrome c biogenesis protein CcsA [Alistipes sp.]